MTTTCQACGAVNDSGAFCGNCGRPLSGGPAEQPTTPPLPGTPPPPAHQAPPAPPAAPMPQPTPQQSGALPPQAPPAHPPQPGWAAPGHPGMAPARPKVNPFLGWPVGDYLRDAAAAFFLFATLGMPWTLDGRDWANAKWWVVIGVLLSVASLALPYVHKAQLIPNWTAVHSRLAKLGANLPLLIGVLAALVNEFINLTEDRAGGLGAGIGMALAGVTLALLPRQAEEPGTGDDGLWNTSAYAAAIAAVLVGTALWVFAIVAGRDFVFEEMLFFFKLLLVSPVLLLVMLGWPLIGLLQGSAAWRRVFASVSFTVLAIALLSLADDGGALFAWPPGDRIWLEGESLFFPGTFLIGAAAGLSVARSLARRTGEQTEPVGEWQKTASSALMLTTAFSGVSLIALIIGIVQDSDDLAAPIVLAVLIVLIGTAAGFALAQVGNARQHRVVLLGVLGGVVLVGFIAMVVANESDTEIGNIFTGPSLPVTAWLVAAWVVLPTLAIYALTVPKDVRTAWGPLIPPQQFDAQPGVPGTSGGYPVPGQPPMPGQPMPPQTGYPAPPPAAPPQQPPPGGYPPPPQ